MKKLIQKSQAGSILYRILKPLISKKYSKQIIEASKYNPRLLHLERIYANHPEQIIRDTQGLTIYTNGILIFPYVSENPTIHIYDFDKNPTQTLNKVIETLIQSIPSYKLYDGEGLLLVYNALKELAINHLQSMFAGLSSSNVFSGYLMKPKLGNNYWRAISHEMDHAYHIPTEEPIGFKNLNEYFSKNNGTELAARGSLLKDYFGFTRNELITPFMLKYAKENYVKDTGLDNNMTEFFNLIDNYDKAANWLSKHASAIIPTTGIGISGSYYNNNK